MRKKSVPIPIPDGSKFCHSCSTAKPLGDFPLNHRFGDGRHWRCISCFSEMNKSRAVLRDGGAWPYESKFCSRCGEYVAITNWSKDSGSRYGLGSHCKKCSAERARDFRKRNGKSYHQSAKKYRDKKRAEQQKRNMAARNTYGDKRRQQCLEYQRKAKLLLYGETENTFSEILESQGGECPICGTELDIKSGSFRKLGKAHIDHDHDAQSRLEYSFRGIICGSCNAGLGFFSDNVEKLREAAKYLERFNKRRGKRIMLA